MSMKGAKRNTTATKQKHYPVLLVSVSLLLAGEADDILILRIDHALIIHEQAV